MLKLSQQSMQKLRESKRDDFARRLTEHLQRTFPKRLTPLSIAEIAERVNGFIRDAQVYGFRYELEIAEFVEYCLGFGLDPSQPQNKVILADIDTAPLEKLERLRRNSHVIPVNSST